MVEAVLQCAKHVHAPPAAALRILVCTPTNASANHICSKLADKITSRVDLLRYISASWNLNQVEEKVRRHTMSSFEDFQLDRVMKATVLVATLCMAAHLHNLGVPRGHFGLIVIDEAGQAMEPEAVAPVAGLLGGNGRLVLAGDPMQLGPVIHQALAKEHGLGTSYLERIMDRKIYRKAPMLVGSAARLPPAATLRAMDVGALQALARQLGLDTSHALEKSELLDLLEAQRAAAGGEAGSEPAGEDGVGMARMGYDAQVITKLVINYRFATSAPPGAERKAQGWGVAVGRLVQALGRRKEGVGWVDGGAWLGTFDSGKATPSQLSCLNPKVRPSQPYQRPQEKLECEERPRLQFPLSPHPAGPAPLGGFAAPRPPSPNSSGHTPRCSACPTCSSTTASSSAR